MQHEQVSRSSDASTTTVADVELDPSVARAFELLERCVSRPALHEDAPVSAAEPALRVGHQRSAASQLSRSAVAVAASAAEPRRERRLQLPRGLIYFLAVAAASAIAGVVASSGFVAIAVALAMSAMILSLDILLSVVDPRLASRLRLAPVGVYRPRTRRTHDRLQPHRN
jgi:hypothetical protein